MGGDGESEFAIKIPPSISKRRAPSDFEKEK
jgi:hypothetical protein